MQRFFLALVVIALLLVADAVSTTSGLKLTVRDFPASVPSLGYDVLDKRLLRVEEEGEERAVAIPGLASLSKAKEWVTSNFSRFKEWYSDRKQVKAWTKEKKTPYEVFQLLNLDENIDTVLNNRKLTTWVRFMRAYNKKNPDGVVTLIGTLTKFYGTLPLAKMIEVSRRNPDTRRLANRLQNDQLTGWAGNGLSTDVVYSMLKVGDGSVEKLLANPALNVWSYFFYRMNKHHPDMEVNMIKKLTSSYDDMELAKAIEVATKDKTTEAIAKRLQRAQFKSWQAEGRHPRAIFDMLRLDTKKWPYDPNVDVYRAYNLFYKANNK